MQIITASERPLSKIGHRGLAECRTRNVWAMGVMGDRGGQSYEAGKYKVMSGGDF